MSQGLIILIIGTGGTRCPRVILSHGVTYGNGIFVAFGDSGTILTSADGISWTVRTSGTTDDLVGVAYGNGTFVAVGSSFNTVDGSYNGTILTSADGITWT